MEELNYGVPQMPLKKTRTMSLRLTKTQKERIKNLTEAKGFLHMSEYLRYSALEKDLIFERKFEEMHKAIMKIKEKIDKLDKAKNNFI